MELMGYDFEAVSTGADEDIAPCAPGEYVEKLALVKAREAPAIYVVSNGRRRPIFNWNTFQAMGYELKNVYSIPAATLDAVAGPLGPVLRLEEATTCRALGI